MLLPFYFKRVSENRYLVSNLLRKFQFVDKVQLEKLCAGTFDEELKDFFQRRRSLIPSLRNIGKTMRGFFTGRRCTFLF